MDEMLMGKYIYVYLFSIIHFSWHYNWSDGDNFTIIPVTT